MGYYHVNRTLKGIILKKFDLSILTETILDNWFPFVSWINKNYPDVCKCSYNEMSKEEKLILLGCLIEMPYCYIAPKNVSDMTPAIAKEIYLNKHYRVAFMLNAIALIFCYQHDYPIDSFECLSDYDDTWMFVCTVVFPLKEYNEKLSKMTESVMAKELSEYLTIVTRENYPEEIYWCEEYIKE